MVKKITPKHRVTASLREASRLIFSRSNLEKYRQLIDESLKEEKEELRQSIKLVEAELRGIARKKSTYYEAIEAGKLSFDLVGERLAELKAEEDELELRKVGLEGQLNSIPESASYSLSDEEFEALKEDIKAFIEEAEPRQKRMFLANFIKSVTVHPDKLVVEYFPPMLPKKKDPVTTGKSGRGLSVIDLAVPTGLEPVSSA